jgi:hypothetical protein
MRRGSCSTGIQNNPTKRFFNLPVVQGVIYDLVRGQISLKKLVDDGNLTAFIIMYRLPQELYKRVQVLQ